MASARRGIWQTVSGRCGVCQTRCLADGVWQTLYLADGVCQTADAMPDTVCQTALCQTLHLPYAASGGGCRLADAVRWRPAVRIWHTVSGRHGIWQTASCRWHLPSGRRGVWQMPRLPYGVYQTALCQMAIWQTTDAMPYAVCQTPHLPDAVCNTLSARRLSARRCICHTRRLPSGRRRQMASGSPHLADAIWQIASAVWLTRRLPDATSARHRLPDAVCQMAVCQMRHLADGVCRLEDSVWQTPSGCQTCQTPSLVLVAIGLSTRVKPKNKARLDSCVF